MQYTDCFVCERIGAVAGQTSAVRLTDPNDAIIETRVSQAIIDKGLRSSSWCRMAVQLGNKKNGRLDAFATPFAAAPLVMWSSARMESRSLIECHIG
jgi:hypothetical protein